MALCAAVLSAFAARAGDLDDGLAAADRGDYAAAMKLWLPLAEQGNMIAQFDVGNLYNNGQGVPQDYVKAIKWYRLSAEQGYEFAEFNVGVFYDRGRGGLPQNPAEAAKWYECAAKKGNVRAQNNLGQLYVHGRGVPRDLVTAAKLYRLAADQGFAGAQMNLGNMYNDGKGVERDAVQAFLWYSSAAAGFSPTEKKFRDQALANLGKTVADMTAEQITEAQRALRSWRPGSKAPQRNIDCSKASPWCRKRIPA
jgi:uncharacterized protein